MKTRKQTKLKWVVTREHAKIQHPMPFGAQGVSVEKIHTDSPFKWFGRIGSMLIPGAYETKAKAKAEVVRALKKELETYR